MNLVDLNFFEVFRWMGVVLVIAGVTLLMFKKRGTSVRGTRDLDTFAVDLTKMAKEGKLDSVVGRETEIMRVTQVLTRRTKNNVIMAGPPGVGKTAIVEGLAQLIAKGDVPDVLKNKRVLSLRVSELLAGTKYRGEFEERVKRVIEEIRASNRTIILFIDEFHTVMQTKGTEGAVGFSDILKPSLARGDLQLIGATTQKEYTELVKPDESMERRFQIILIDEPSVAETVKILQGVKKSYEDFHKVKFTDEAISAAAHLSEEYIKNRRLPDKAIDIMDEAAAMVNVQGGTHHHAAALLHGAAQRRSGGTSDSVPEITVAHIKEVVGEWVGLNADEIH